MSTPPLPVAGRGAALRGGEGFVFYLVSDARGAPVARDPRASKKQVAREALTAEDRDSPQGE